MVSYFSDTAAFPPMYLSLKFDYEHSQVRVFLCIQIYVSMFDIMLRKPFHCSLNF